MRMYMVFTVGDIMTSTNPSRKLRPQSARQFRPERLVGIRNERGLSQEELARRVGVASQQVLRWENGKNVPSGDAIAKMAEILSVTSDYLLGLVDDNRAYFQVPELSPTEWSLVLSVRDGEFLDAIEQLVDEAKKASKSPEEGSEEP